MGNKVNKSCELQWVTPAMIASASSGIRGGRSVGDIARSLLERPDGRIDDLVVSLLRTCGTKALANEVSQLLGMPVADIDQALGETLQLSAIRDVRLTGAEATAVILRSSGVQIVFAYPGTSELALCASLERTPGIRLVNGRGDKECAFLASGASLLKPSLAVAILHGARGLTNATGAIADIRRNEIATGIIVGLPSTDTSRFLPPHGETGLIESIGHFVKWRQQQEPIPHDEPDRAEAVMSFLNSLYMTVEKARTIPYGPTIFGIPQDVAERAWIPLSSLLARHHAHEGLQHPEAQIRVAAKLLIEHGRAIILIDDYLLKYQEAKPALARFAELIGAPILQVRYRRGPMLFERLTNLEVPNFLGWLDSQSCEHQLMLDAANLLVTVEDRNMYHRVVGNLPGCRKIAISSDGSKAIKNEYLREGDLLIEGDVVKILQGICYNLVRCGVNRKDMHWARSIEVTGSASGPAIAPVIRLLRTGIVKSIARAMADLAAPVVVDDSQMFGGLISEHYDILPAKLRVFGDHGAFVGSGIGYATGLAIANPTARVFCFLGDQGFINGIQGLVAANQERAPVIFLVCNNGGSVSLLKQSSVAREPEASNRYETYLENTQNLEYARIATKLGVSARVVDFSTDQGVIGVERSISDFERALAGAVNEDGPSLVEMRLPGPGEFWAGIWRVQGYDEAESRAGDVSPPIQRRALCSGSRRENETSLVAPEKGP
jgi:acetolactate synthase-1/2/3 large subunit